MRSPARRPATAPVPATADREIERTGSRAAVGGAFGLFLLNVLIWAVVSLSSREWIYFWPIWTAIPFITPGLNRKEKRYAIPFVFAVMGLASQSRRDRRRDR